MSAAEEADVVQFFNFVGGVWDLVTVDASARGKFIIKMD